MEKNQAFEYFVSKLLEWYNELNGQDKVNDLSTLKVLKLLFFCSAINTKKGQEGTLLDYPFNNFYAMPYGHVESEIYSDIKANQFPNVEINNSTTNFINQIDYPDGDIKTKINDSIERLKLENKNLINMTSFDLVELSHRWYSWRYYFAKAKRNYTYSESIPSEIIKAEEKIFSLN